MSQHPFLNLGCGRVILPAPKPAHYALLPDAVTNYPLYWNVDRNAEPGVDQVMDLFTYPWELPSDSFDGALLSHLIEHIPHAIRPAFIAPETDDERQWWHDRREALADMQDGWFCFFSELFRVLTDGAPVHVLAPYAWSAGAASDPTHTRLITEHSFYHSMKPDPNSPFQYQTGGIHFEVEDINYSIYTMFSHLVATPNDAPSEQQRKAVQLQEALQTRLNVADTIYARLRVVKS